MNPRIIHGEVVPERECIDLDRDESYLFHALTAPLAQEQAEAQSVAEAFRIAARDKAQRRAWRWLFLRYEVVPRLIGLAVIVGVVLWGSR